MTILRKENIGLIGFDNEDKLPFVIEHDVLTELEKSQFNIVENKNISGALLNGPIYLSLFPTLDCDKHCDFCYYLELLNKKEDYKLMSVETADKTIEFCKKYGILSVNVIGGEPLLPEVWSVSEYLTRRLLEEGMAVSLLTNGYGLKNVAKTLSEIQKKHPAQFGLTVSTNPDDYSQNKYKDLELSFNEAKKYNLKFSINSIVIKDNVRLHKI